MNEPALTPCPQRRPSFRCSRRSGSCLQSTSSQECLPELTPLRFAFSLHLIVSHLFLAWHLLTPLSRSIGGRTREGRGDFHFVRGAYEQDERASPRVGIVWPESHHSPVRALAGKGRVDSLFVTGSGRPTIKGLSKRRLSSPAPRRQQPLSSQRQRFLPFSTTLDTWPSLAGLF